MSQVFHISEATSIALHSMALLARENRPMKAEEMAQHTGSSRNHLAKIFQTLVRNGFINSQRGPGGGFQLKKDPSEISLLDIYELFEGKIETPVCGIDGHQCPFNNCIFGNLRSDVTRQALDYFSSKKLSDIK